MCGKYVAYGGGRGDGAATAYGGGGSGPKLAAVEEDAYEMGIKKAK